MIQRTRLLQGIADPSRRRWLVEAGAGMGKTVLLEHIRATLVEPLVIVRRPVDRADLPAFVAELSAATRRAGHAQTAQALAATGGVAPAAARALSDGNRSLAIDDVDTWDDEVFAWILTMEAALSADVDLLLAGRLIPQPLQHLREAAGWTTISAADLALTAEETGEMLASIGVDDAMANATLGRITSGWPLAVDAAVKQMRLSPNPGDVVHRLARRDSLVGALLDGYLGAVESSDLEALYALARLPFFDAQVAESLGSPGVLERLASAGMPITRRTDGWAEIVDPFRSAVGRQASQTLQLPESVTDHYVSRNEVHTAISACLATGDRLRAARTIARLTRTQEDQLDVAGLNSAILAIGDVVEQAPRALVMQSRALAVAGRITEAGQAIERAIGYYAAADPEIRDDHHIEALLFSATFAAYQGEPERAEIVEAQCAPLVAQSNSLTLRAGLHDLRALIGHARATDSALETARQELLAALAIRRELEDWSNAAVTLLRLVVNVLTPLGRHTEALGLLDEVPTMGNLSLVNQLRVAVARAVAFTHVGRAHEVHELLIEPRRVAQMIGHEQLVGVSLVTEIQACSVIGDTGRLLALVDEFESGGLLVFSPHSHALSWIMISEALARVDQIDRARAALRHADGIPAVRPTILLAARASIDARSDSVEAAMAALQEAEENGDLEPNLRWQSLVLRSYCQLRLGRLDEADADLQAAFELCRANGDPGLPQIVEHRLVSRIRKALEGVSSTVEPKAIVEVSIFDEFSVAINGALVEVPRGQPADVIKLLTLGAGRVHTSSMIDAFWPDAERDVGRSRLRKVLNRLRRACGPIVQRDNDELVFAVGVSADYARATEAAHQALSTHSSLALTEHALSLLDRDLLATNRYDEWAEQARDDQRRTVLRLLDRKANIATSSGDFELATAALEQAVRLDPTDGHRARRAVDLLDHDGRHAAARALERSLSAAHSLS